MNSLGKLFSHAKLISRVYQTIGIRSMSAEAYKFETLKVTSPTENVLHVELNRPEKRNAMNQAFWREMVECFEQITDDSDCRSVVMSGAGKSFTAGLDLADFAGVINPTGDDELESARKAFHIRKIIEKYQKTFTVIEQCPKPVIVAVHGACVGGGIDMITACDIRYCTSDAFFVIKEVDIGLAADVGTLQRLPKVVGNDSLVRELCYTGRPFPADEAKDFGLVSRVFPDKEKMVEGALELASVIASKSPIAVQGTKVNLIYSRDHPVPESLHYMTTWNMSMLQSEDVMKAAMASMQKQTAKFSKL